MGRREVSPDSGTCPHRYAGQISHLLGGHGEGQKLGVWGRSSWDMSCRSLKPERDVLSPSRGSGWEVPSGSGQDKLTARPPG